MAETALRSKLVVVERTFERPHDEPLPWSWSVAVLLALAGASWGAIYLLVSLFL